MAGGRPLRITWAEADTAPALQARYRAERDGRVAVRLQALWRVRAGASLRRAAQLAGVHERLVRRWVAWYRQGGLAAVVGHRLGGRGRPPRLTPAQQAELHTHLCSGAVYTVQDAIAWVEQRFGVTYRPKGMYSLLQRLGAHPKVPRPHNPKSTPAQQEAWKKGGSPTPCAPQASPSPPA
jgi:transposase